MLAIYQLIYDYTVMYMTDVVGISIIPDTTPQVVKEVIERLRQSYISSSPVQQKVIQKDLETLIEELKEIYPKQFEKYGK